MHKKSQWAFFTHLDAMAWVIEIFMTLRRNTDIQIDRVTLQCMVEKQQQWKKTQFYKRKDPFCMETVVNI